MARKLITITEEQAIGIAKQRMLEGNRDVSFMQARYCGTDSLEYKYSRKCSWKISFLADDRSGVLPADIHLYVHPSTGEIIDGIGYHF